MSSLIVRCACGVPARMQLRSASPRSPYRADHVSRDHADRARSINLASWLQPSAIPTARRARASCGADSSATLERAPCAGDDAGAPALTPPVGSEQCRNSSAPAKRRSGSGSSSASSPSSRCGSSHCREDGSSMRAGCAGTPTSASWCSTRRWYGSWFRWPRRTGGGGREPRMGDSQPVRAAVLAGSPDRARRARSGHLSAARDVPRAARAVAAASHAPRRSRLRRDDRLPVPSDRDPRVGVDQDGRGGPPRPARGGGAGVRDPVERDLDVQPRQCPPSGGAGPGAALGRRHAGHAPGPPLRCSRRDQQQLRFQPALVGSPVRHLPGATESRARAHDNRHRRLPGAARTAPAPDAGAAAAARRRGLRDQPPSARAWWAPPDPVDSGRPRGPRSRELPGHARESVALRRDDRQALRVADPGASPVAQSTIGTVGGHGARLAESSLTRSGAAGPRRDPPSGLPDPRVRCAGASGRAFPSTVRRRGARAWRAATPGSRSRPRRSRCERA